MRRMRVDMSKKNIGAYSSAARVVARAQTITQRAKEELLKQGIFYPVWYPGRNVDEFYEAVRAYGAKETAMIMSLDAPQPRPVIEVKSELKTKDWARPYYDD